VAVGTALGPVSADEIRIRGTIRAAIVGATKLAEVFADGGVADQHPHSGFGVLRQLSSLPCPFIGQQLFAAIVLQHEQAFGLDVGAQGLPATVTPPNAWTKKAKQNRIDTGMRRRITLALFYVGVGHNIFARGAQPGPREGLSPPINL
jgi:hypothetical protein